MTRLPLRRTALAGLGALLALGGCDRQAAKPVGDVIATVAGRDITKRDLDAEARARGIRFDTKDGTATRNALLGYLVSRTMLLDVAHKSKLDRKPVLLADRLRADANVVAQAQAAVWMAGQPGVTEQQLAKVRGDNPQIFTGRQTLLVDQVRFPATANLPGSGGRETLDAVSAQLDQLRTPHDRVRQAVDTAQIPRATVEQLMANPTVPLRFDTGAVGNYVVLLQAKPNPAPEAEQRQLALRMLQNTYLDNRIAAEVKAMRRDGRVSYRAGYEPKP